MEITLARNYGLVRDTCDFRPQGAQSRKIGFCCKKALSTYGTDAITTFVEQ
jgi:hypothetical protein